MHRHTTHIKCYATFKDFSTAMLNFLRDDVPTNWRTYCDEVTDNFRVIDPKDFRIIQASLLRCAQGPPVSWVTSLPVCTKNDCRRVVGDDLANARPEPGYLEPTEALFEANGLVEIGHDPLADLFEAHYRRMEAEVLSPRSHRRYSAWGNAPGRRPE